VARKITTQALENSRMTQTNLEIVGSARFFSSLLGHYSDSLLFPVTRKCRHRYCGVTLAGFGAVVASKIKRLSSCFPVFFPVP
jgi:hypothetical protein